MLDNFRELAETQLQCAVCSEVLVEATSVNCGHTFCHYCINEWKKKMFHGAGGGADVLAPLQLRQGAGVLGGLQGRVL